MNTGMLWFDNDPRTALSDKVQKAADYYRRKYGRVPDLCLVHPSMLTAQADRQSANGKVDVRCHRAILPGHLWIGEDEKN